MQTSCVLCYKLDNTLQCDIGKDITAHACFCSKTPLLQSLSGQHDMTSNHLSCKHHHKF